MATPNYERYPLSRIISLNEIVSADYVRGIYTADDEHFHEQAWELCVCMEGRIEVFRQQKCFELETGQLLLIEPRLTHDIGIRQKEGAAFVISFTCTENEQLRPLKDAVIAVDEAQLELFRCMIDELKSAFGTGLDSDYWQPMHLYHFVPYEHEHPLLGAEQMICCYLEQILITLLRKAAMEPGFTVHSGYFRAAVQSYLVQQISAYIDANLREHLTVEAIAEHFHYSRARLSTIYKNATGLGIKEAINYKRIRKAMVLLQEQKKTVTQISEELGFSTPQYFSHIFTKQVGIPPSRFGPQSDSKRPARNDTKEP